jgi:hypothetical protein
VPKGYDVVTYGDIGDKFYIILHGNVGVYIPMSNIKKQKPQNKNQLGPKIKKLKRQESEGSEEFELPTEKIMSKRRVGKIVTGAPVDDATAKLMSFHLQMERDQYK